jgi:predicted metal-dependent HD superfamily phosphohydrolase
MVLRLDFARQGNSVIANGEAARQSRWGGWIASSHVVLLAMRNPSYDKCVVEAELRARAAYAEPHRHYHSERHLDECLQHLDGVHGPSERERRILRWAILWHDAFYEPGRGDNEEQSAERAYSELSACRVEEADAAEVARLIRLTREHRVESRDHIGAILVSIDLAILGSDPEGYRAYAEAVRREYAHVPDAEWRFGRSLVLTHLLTADPLYPDREFRARLEDQARRNMTEELRRLRAS